MLCCLLALLIIVPLGLAATAPRGGTRPACCRADFSRLWLMAAIGVLVMFCAVMAVLFWYAAPAQSFFRHICSVFPLKA